LFVRTDGETGQLQIPQVAPWGYGQMSPLGRRAKRALDIVLALIGLAILSPLFAVVAVLIKLDSPGPVFFRQRRVGLGGRLFRIYKFRTMVQGAYQMGSRLTVKRDPRITRLGKFLRWSKIDELPQLINVLKGEMSFVGPRPEDPYFVQFYRGEQQQVLSVPPGIFGPSQIHGRDEEDEYPDGLKDTEAYYLEHILPAKLQRDLDYIRNATFWSELKFLLGGVWATVRGAFRARYLWQRRRRIALLGIDVGTAVAAYLLALAIRFDWHVPDADYVPQTLLLIVLLRPAAAVYFGVYQSVLRYFGLWDFIAVFKAVTTSSLLVAALTYFLGMQSHPRSVFVIDWALVLLAWGGVRGALRTYLRAAPRSRKQRMRALIVGTGLGGEQLCRAMIEEPFAAYTPVGFIDEVPDRWGARIHGVKVLGGIAELPLALSAKRIDSVFVCLSDLTEDVSRGAIEVCARAQVPCRIVPALNQLLQPAATQPKTVPAQPQVVAVN
jgi:lipopolysaccharide/colanic/teichoic acid biosynthesis glycosyltransferase